MSKTFTELRFEPEEYIKIVDQIIEKAIVDGAITQEHVDELDRKLAAMSSEELIKMGLDIIKNADETLAKYTKKSE